MGEERPLVVGIAGWSGAGKTTLVVALTRLLKQRGHRVACIKHAPHGADFDEPGSDTARMTEAGGDAVLLCTSSAAVTIRPHSADLTLEEALDLLPPADVVLVEGFHDAAIPRIEVAVDGRPLRSSSAQLIAVVSDNPRPDVTAPQLPWRDIEALARVLMRLMAPVVPARL